jgi:hypothetical protein
MDNSRVAWVYERIELRENCLESRRSRRLENSAYAVRIKVFEFMEAAQGAAPEI